MTGVEGAFRRARSEAEVLGVPREYKDESLWIPHLVSDTMAFSLRQVLPVPGLDPSHHLLDILRPSPRSDQQDLRCVHYNDIIHS